jgi:hypothetical protein
MSSEEEKNPVPIYYVVQSDPKEVPSTGAFSSAGYGSTAKSAKEALFKSLNNPNLKLEPGSEIMGAYRTIKGAPKYIIAVKKSSSGGKSRKSRKSRRGKKSRSIKRNKSRRFSRR